MARSADRSRTDVRAVVEQVPAAATRAKLSCRAVRWAALLAFVGALLLVQARMGDVEAQMRRDTLTLVTATGEHKISIEIAETNEEKALGLMFRTSLADDAGMLFPYAPPQETGMWMRNTYIPLDMVFIREDGTVHRIEARTEPLSETVISSRGPITAVLEIAAGNAERLGLKAGDKVLHPHFKTGRR